MEDENIATCTVCKKSESSFYEATNALMHEPNKELYNFNICANCETVFLTNPVDSENLNRWWIIKSWTTK